GCAGSTVGRSKPPSGTVRPVRWFSLGFPRAAPDGESARRLRETVAENLLGGNPAFLEPGPNRVGRFAVIFEIMGGEFCGSSALSLRDGIDFAPKTGAGFKQIFDFNSCIAD